MSAEPVFDRTPTSCNVALADLRFATILQLMRPLAAKLLLRLDSSARSGGVFTQHVLSGRASTLLVSRFHFRLSYFHVAR